jgi:hypothetical protein
MGVSHAAGEHLASPESTAPAAPSRAVMGALRYAWVFAAYDRQRVAVEDANCARLRQLGYDVHPFGVPCPGGWWPFAQLDAAWRGGDRGLLTAYEQLADLLRSCHVLIAGGGAMLHPEFLATADVCKVFLCADDPESSAVLSRPVAPAFDFCFPFNIAAVDDYRRWGCRAVRWLFHAVREEWLTPGVTATSILEGTRELDTAVFCERVYGLSDRPQRIERLQAAFPQTVVRGAGWPGGAASPDEVHATYLRLRCGFNLHHSVGPCNTRSVHLPAAGVMQICDNKHWLGELFTLEREVVGFDSIAECIDKTRYYLAHERERREIAAAGFVRATRDYTPQKQWQRIVDTIAPHCVPRFARRVRAQ